MAFLTLGADMARPSRTGGKTSRAKARNASPAKGRKTTKTKPRLVPATTRVKRRSVSDPSKDLKVAREQQAATAEILKVIASSPTDVQPVLEAVAERAMSLLDAWSVLVTRFDGKLLHFGAARGALPDTEQFLRNQHPMRPEAAVFPGRCILERSAVNISDAQADPSPQSRERARLRGFRAHLSVPMLRDGQPNGVISVSRREAGAFAANEVELLQTFADQAVIAIENVRLFNETKESLERQTATADILKVIASSPNDVQPVFEAIAARANKLIGGYATTVLRFVGDMVDLAAFTPVSEEADAVLQATFPLPLAGNPQFETAYRGEIVEIVDAELYPHLPIRNLARARGFRSRLLVPLRHDSGTIGAISVTRVAPGNFANHHIQLLQTFADQAVIAIGNVRLFEQVQERTRDLTESLQQQTATADVLKVISRSAFDLQRVLDTLAASASRLCDAYDAVILLREGEFLRIAAHYGEIPVVDKWPVSRDWIGGRAVVDRMPVHVHDLLAEEAEFPMAHAFALQTGHRTLFAVPLMREQDVIGAIIIRRTEVRPFTDKQIELVQTFADQAVIAIENVRLFDEVQAKTSDLRETLRQQTATADVLKVIASSPTDVGPALQAVVESACRFCDAYDAGVVLKFGNDLHFSAHHGPISTGREPRPISRDWVTGRSVIDKMTLQISDFQAPEAAEFPEGQRQSREQGHRCTLATPLLRDGEAIGALVLRRLEPVAFTDKQVKLLQTFADQAVIAIGNVRMFEQVQAKTRDLEESLQQQTATADVLKSHQSLVGRARKGSRNSGGYGGAPLRCRPSVYVPPAT